MEIGASDSLTVTVLPADAANKSIEWISSDSAVATVNDGVVTAIATGCATITARASDGSEVIAECSVTVTGVTTGLNETDVADERVYVANSTILIDGSHRGLTVRILTINGVELWRHVYEDTPLSYQPYTKGIYIVMVGEKAYKLAIE